MTDYTKEIATLPRFAEMSPSERTLVEQPDLLWRQDYEYFRSVCGSDKERAAMQADINFENRKKKLAAEKAERERARPAAASFNPRLVDVAKVSVKDDDLAEMVDRLKKAFPNVELSDDELNGAVAASIRDAAENFNAAARGASGSLTSFLRSMFEIVAVDALISALAAREARLELAKRVEALEQQQSNFEYRGVWRANESYRQNNFATFGGGLWVAKIDSTGLKPGDNNNAWQLAVKAGRDGRDASAEEIARALLPDVLRKIEGRGQ